MFKHKILLIFSTFFVFAKEIKFSPVWRLNQRRTVEIFKFSGLAKKVIRLMKNRYVLAH